MKITGLYVYPIKAIRGIRLNEAQIGQQGIKYDRHFILCRVSQVGEFEKIQLSKYPECSLFDPQISDDKLRVKYHIPKEPLVEFHPLQEQVLEIPLEPETNGLERNEINVHQSLVSVWRMGYVFDAWFSACFGFDVALLYIGRERRPVLGTFSPRNQPQPVSKGWLSSITDRIYGGSEPEPDWLTFSDVAPLLITTEASLNNVKARMSDGNAEMYKFRPNLVVDGEGEFDEDFWAELTINGEKAVILTKLCNRCTSLNVDYDTGRTAAGEHGTVLKKLMSDRRVDLGLRYSPTFGKYGFLADGAEDLQVAIGDQVSVIKRTVERPVWDWPLKDQKIARYYRYS